jgi:hypothetical protein
MPTNLFISYDHDDQAQVNGFKAIKFNPNHGLDFHDHSLKDAVRDRAGSPIKCPPGDLRSQRVREEISAKLERATKLLVLIGDLTHQSEWVDWEIREFVKGRQRRSGEGSVRRVRGMRLKGCAGAKLPPAFGIYGLQSLDWDPYALLRWLDENPNG